MSEQIKSLKTGIKYKDTPIGKIPVDWEVVRLKGICDVIGGSTPSTARKDFWNGDIPFATPTDITNLRGREISDTKQKITQEGLSSCGTRLLPAGAVLLTSRATIGACAINARPMATNQGFASLVCNEKAYNWYIFYEMMLRKSELQRLGSGSTFKEVSKNSLRLLNITLPPLAEQKKIAEILSTVDEAIENTDQVIEKTKEAKKGLMQRLLTRGIGHKKFKKTEIGEIPIEWNIESLIEVLVLQRGFDLPVQRRIKGQYPILASNGVIDYHQEFKVKGPGIVTGRSGTLGKVHYIESNYWPLNTALYVKEFYNNHPKFIYYFLQSLSTEKYGTGTGVPTLNRNILHKIKVAIPPLDEQIKIAEIISESDAEIEKELNYRAELERIKTGLMQVLLTGRIRVKA